MLSHASAHRMRRLLLAALIALAAATPAHAATPKRPPVVMLLLDEFPLADIQRPDGSIDSVRFPGFAALQRESTWFPNAASVHDATQQAVPAMLTGRLPATLSAPNYRSHPDSIFGFLRAAGYRVRAREEATTVCPRTLCGRSDHYGNPEFNRLYERRERLQQTITGLSGLRRGTFVFHHSLLPHGPWVYLPSGRRRTGPRAIAFPEIAAPAGFGNPFLTRHLEQRHLLQAGFVDREVGRMVRMIKRSGQWQRALVVVAADHGMSFRIGARDRREVTPENVHEIAPVPLFIKRPGQTSGRVLGAYARTVDVVPTVAGLLGRRLPWRVDGRDAFGPEVARRAGVEIARRDLSGTVTVPAREMELRRQADRIQRAALFGTGPWAGVFRIGPNRGLLGRELPNPAGTTEPGRPVAHFMAPRSLSDVDLAGGESPALAAGWIENGSTSGGRDLAVTVNGRVAAVGRSFHIDTQAAEWFSITVPESTLRQGRNTMAVFEVTAGGELVPLGVKR